jgi:putative transcriptional regulator
MKNEVRRLRTSRGLSQERLAAEMDVSRQTINSIETERYTPSLPLAIALARYFDKTVEEVFDATVPKSTRASPRSSPVRRGAATGGSSA